MRALGYLPILLAACSSSSGMKADSAPVPAPFDECSGECQVMTLEAVFGTATLAFGEAYFGFSTGGDIYVEAYAGGSGGCPTETSPTPTATLALSGLERSDGPGAQADFSASLFDFGGSLLPTVPVEQSTGTSMIWSAADYASFVAFEVETNFAEGDVDGHIYATYCPSLDE